MKLVHSGYWAMWRSRRPFVRPMRWRRRGGCFGVLALIALIALTFFLFRACSPK